MNQVLLPSGDTINLNWNFLEFKERLKLKDTIVYLHCQLDFVFNRMVCSDREPDTLYLLFKEGSHIEALLQMAWGFPVNEEFHGGSRRYPYCSCLCKFEACRRDLDEDCPVHGIGTLPRFNQLHPGTPLTNQAEFQPSEDVVAILQDLNAQLPDRFKTPGCPEIHRILGGSHA